MSYELVKTIHILAIISWMAGLLYLPRLFVYHAGAKVGDELSETLKVMERRLLRFIMNPAMFVSWGAGLWLAHMGHFGLDAWFIAKFAFVVVLTASHMAMGRFMKAFARDDNCQTARFYRIINEIPTVLMILIVILVVYKPWL